MRNNKLLTASFIALLVLIIIELFVYANYNKLTEDEVSISFVVTGDNLDAWENMKSGAQTAALDRNCQVTFLNSPIAAGADGEIEMIERQLADGADYVVIASGFYDEVKEYVEDEKLQSKVYFAKNGPYGLKNGVIADDYSLGKDYAAFIMDNSNDKNLLVLYTAENINNDKIIEGLSDGFENTDVTIEVQKLTADDSTITFFITKAIAEKRYDGAIILDSAVLDDAVNVEGLIDSSFNIYGVDDRQAAVYYLDSDLIKALACKDDYTIGFMAINQVLSKGKKELPKVHLYYIVEREDIYSEQYEKVLFPFAK
ncbi:substrate-binding domain-containing protein [Pseudobutyrivibrio sp. MD2005]|uniref:substrate-binding domain-containing protein n=1 Tax=Pseudobutyrivibrio sp. MD2005 TaxID=1410616 RepID=UPI0004818186|nr:substrate-binding domain-containing protein [Pseudobutyrivibrio sp. MD2005]